MSMYTKFTKHHLTKKGKYITNESVVVEDNYSILIQRTLHLKFKNSQSVTIPFSIGAISVGRTLIDSGGKYQLNVSFDAMKNWQFGTHVNSNDSSTSKLLHQKTM